MTEHKPLHAAVIGLGRMGSTYDDEIGPYSRWQSPHAHAACYRAVAGIELVAGADPHEGQRAAFAARWSLDPARVYADHREMLARERPDIVSIATSTRPRADIVQGVVDAGSGVRAIWAEKPLSMSLEESDRMVAACRDAGIILAVGASRCWDATYNRMRALIDQGAIGKPLQIIALAPANLSHMGSHSLTLLAYLAGGRCRWVFGQMEDDEAAAGDDDLRGNGYLQFDNGVQAFVRAVSCGAAAWEFDVIGTEGRLRAISDGEEVEFWKLQASELPGRPREQARLVFPRPQRVDTPNARTVQDLLACLEDGTEPICNGEAGRHALEIAIAMRESHRRGGRRVDLPLADRALRMNAAETLHGEEPVIARRRPAQA